MKQTQHLDTPFRIAIGLIFFAVGIVVAFFPCYHYLGGLEGFTPALTLRDLSFVAICGYLSGKFTQLSLSILFPYDTRTS